MKIKCIESVQLRDLDGMPAYEAFTAGMEYTARRALIQGLNGDPFIAVAVLRARNNKNLPHIIKRLEEGADSAFFEKHFEVVVPGKKNKGGKGV